jgi:hypothetical protein
MGPKEGGESMSTLKTPTQRKLAERPPTDISHQSMQKKKAFVQRFARKFHVIFDEDSMMGRETCVWLFHGLKEVSCGLTQPGMDINHGDIYPPESAVRFAGDVPIIASYGDIHQLLDVGKTSLFYNTSGNIGSADAEGRVAFPFLNPEHDSGTIGVSVIMDQSIRESDPLFKGIIESFRDGTVTKQQADVVMKRRLSQLPLEEYTDFCDNAFYVMPT